MKTCPTCGMPVRTFSTDEGTCGFEPLSAEQLAIIEAVLAGDYEDVPLNVRRCDEGHWLVWQSKPNPCPTCGGDHDPFSVHPHENELCANPCPECAEEVTR